MKQTEHPTSVVWSCAAHAARAYKEKWCCAQPCSPIPLPEQHRSALPRAGFLLGTWITSLLCAVPFLPQSQTGPENLSQWAANKMQRLLNTDYLEGSFSSSRPRGSSSRTGHQLLPLAAMTHQYLLLLGAGTQSSGSPASSTLTPSLLLDWEPTSSLLSPTSTTSLTESALHNSPPQHRAATHLRRDDKLCSSPQNFKRVCHSGGWTVHSS